ncbi:AP-2 complex subunit beta [Pseudohyphozyma bogoriensis]|nr:AP-2 complex subunit beta [Pseudohyphozyma bogoriensis]
MRIADLLNPPVASTSQVPATEAALVSTTSTPPACPSGPPDDEEGSCTTFTIPRSERARPLSPAPSVASFDRELAGIKERMWMESGSAREWQMNSKELVRIEIAHPNLASASQQLKGHFNHYLTVCEHLYIPPFPITSTKAAIVLAPASDLPWARYLRKLIATPPLPPSEVRNAFLSLRVCAQATDHYWFRVAESFLDDPESYSVIVDVLKACQEKEKALRHRAKVHRPAPPPPPAPEWPSLKSIKSFLTNIPTLMSELKEVAVKEKDSPSHEAAFRRIHQTLESLDPGNRTQSRRNAWFEYAGFVSSIHVAPHPIEASKLLLFALAFWKGPNSKMAERLAPQLRRNKQMALSDVDEILTHLGKLMVIARPDIGDEEQAQWASWRKELRTSEDVTEGIDVRPPPSPPKPMLAPPSPTKRSRPATKAESEDEGSVESKKQAKKSRFYEIVEVELRTELQGEKKDKNFTKRKQVLKKVVASMTMGQDMSPLYPEILACLSIQVLEIKKMVYLFLINYARVKPEMVNHALGGLLADANDTNALIRALALRTMSYITVPAVTKALVEPLHHCLKDRDPYVRKTAAICVGKLYFYDRRLVEKEQFVSKLRDLLGDTNSTVVANAVAALTEISERSDNIHLRLNATVASRLVQTMGECSEWGQTYILEALMYYTPEEHADAELLAERIAIRLQHSNSAVVLTTIKVIMYLMNYMGSEEIVDSMCRKLSPPLVTLLSSGYEVQYVALRNILLIIQRRPQVLKNDVKVFFCKYNDPIYVKLAKLEIIYRLANEKNVEQVLAELKEYASEVDVDFVRKAVRSIGRLAIKITTAADLCISVLLALVHTKVNYVVQEAIVVIKDIFRRYPGQYEGIIGALCENIDALDTPDAKAAMIWIVGQYADLIENSDELLDDFLFTFLEEPTEVQFALLTATVKLFIKKPEAGQQLVPKVLKWATEEIDNPDLRDRGFIYWRLLSTDPGAATNIVFSERPQISTESEAMDRGVLDRLLLHAGTLASLYGKEPQTFIRGAKAKQLLDSEALDPVAKQSFLDSLNLPSYLPPPVQPTSSAQLSPPPPVLPPKPRGSTDDYGPDGGDFGTAGRVGLLDDDGDDEEEGAALNPGQMAISQGVSPGAELEDPLDPYASLARLSIDGFGSGGLRSAGTDGGYGYASQSPLPLRGGQNEDLL